MSSRFVAQVVIATSVSALIAIGSSASAQDPRISFGGGGMGMQIKPEIQPAEQTKSLAEIELKLERVLELLPLALPGADLHDDRSVLVNFFDRIVAKAGGEQMTPVSNYANSTTSTGRNELDDLDAKL